MHAKKSTKYYQENPGARKKKAQYDKKYHSSPSRIKYRAELNQKNREAGTYGNGDGKDYDHGERRMINQSVNRAKDRPVKKAQSGMYVPPAVREMQSMDPDYIHDMGVAPETTVTAKAPKFAPGKRTIENYRKSHGNFDPVAWDKLRPAYPIFDLLSGRTIGKGAIAGGKVAFDLAKSVIRNAPPSWFQKHGSKVIKGLFALDMANDFEEITGVDILDTVNEAIEQTLDGGRQKIDPEPGTSILKKNTESSVQAAFNPTASLYEAYQRLVKKGKPEDQFLFKDQIDYESHRNPQNEEDRVELDPEYRKKLINSKSGFPYYDEQFGD